MNSSRRYQIVALALTLPLGGCTTCQESQSGVQDAASPPSQAMAPALVSADANIHVDLTHPPRVIPNILHNRDTFKGLRGRHDHPDAGVP